MPEYLTNGKFEQFEKRVFEKLDDIKSDQKELKETNIKNAPVIAFAAKLQSNMSKIVTGIIVAVGGSWVVGSTSNQQDAPKTETVQKSDKVEAKK